ncbi:uncharacterized protein [Heliangelus exortis]|uniref:uncharacterized protein n=1 Tax=Heliangelus exortis TaxID=472823 RepID=UPI003A8D787F
MLGRSLLTAALQAASIISVSKQQCCAGDPLGARCLGTSRVSLESEHGTKQGVAHRDTSPQSNSKQLGFCSHSMNKQEGMAGWYPEKLGVKAESNGLRGAREKDTRFKNCMRRNAEEADQSGKASAKKLTKKEVDAALLCVSKVKPGPTFFRQLGDKGLISYAEYLFLLTILTKPQTGLQIAFKMLDVDGNEQLEKKEFVKLQKIIGKEDDLKTDGEETVFQV